ncbi:MAG: glycine zipper family protein [Lutibacter sp.]|nr:glycine zipper family protein [Lutibacter sp.]
MKKIILTFFGLLIIGTVIFVSCEKNESQTTDLSALKLDMINKYKVVGEDHNRNLSLILQDIKEKKNTISTKEDFINVFNSSLIEVITNSNISNQYNISQSEILELANSNFQSQFNHGKSNLSDSQLNSLSEEFRDILDRLIAISNNKELTITKEQKLIDYLDDEAVIKLTDEKELNVYFGASSVAKYSFEYWTNNIDQWLVLIKEINLNSNKINPNSNKTEKVQYEMLDGVVGADVGGAVAGALTAAITGPVGWVAGGIIGSSATSSGKFATNVWNYFF